METVQLNQLKSILQKHENTANIFFKSFSTLAKTFKSNKLIYKNLITNMEKICKNEQIPNMKNIFRETEDSIVSINEGFNHYVNKF